MAENFIEEMQEWHSEIGRLVLAFGDIEHSIYLILSECTKTNFYPEYQDKDFVCRARKSIEIIKNLDPEYEYGEELIQLLKGAMSLIETRNIIAHNPLHPIVTNDAEVSLSVISTKNSNKIVEFCILSEAANKATAINSEMYRLTNALSCKTT